MLISNLSFNIEGRYRKDPSRPYQIEFIDTFEGVTFWVKNKHLEVVAFDHSGTCLVNSEYKREGIFSGSSYIFFDNLKNIVVEIKKGAPFAGHSVFLNDVKVGSVRPQKKQEIKGMSLNLSSTGSSIEMSSKNKKTPSLSDFCVGYFGWLIFKRWEEMD